METNKKLRKFEFSCRRRRRRRVAAVSAKPPPPNGLPPVPHPQFSVKLHVSKLKMQVSSTQFLEEYFTNGGS